jgi:hypothetical protein
MSAHSYHKRLRLKNFTAFMDATFEFVPGINAFVGENGTGKTHVMKAMYAMQLTQSRESRAISDTLEDLFQTKNVADIIRMGTEAGAIAEVSGLYGGHEWSYAVQRATPSGLAADNRIPKPDRPVFIPAIDMMGHTKGFTEAYEEIRLDFDLTCRDIVNLLRLERRNGSTQALAGDTLANLLGGDIERDDDGRFYLVTDLGRLPMPLVAEGLRKIATLVQLQRNGWLSEGTTLFWDEPEVNLNPILMDEVIGAILALARTGVQVFLATHSYIILREIEVQAQKSDRLRFFSLVRTDQGVRVNPANSYLEIEPNAIERQYGDLYDRGIEKRLHSLETK